MTNDEIKEFIYRCAHDVGFERAEPFASYTKNAGVKVAVTQPGDNHIVMLKFKPPIDEYFMIHLINLLANVNTVKTKKERNDTLYLIGKEANIIDVFNGDVFTRKHGALDARRTLNKEYAAYVPNRFGLFQQLIQVFEPIFATNDDRTLQQFKSTKFKEPYNPRLDLRAALGGDGKESKNNIQQNVKPIIKTNSNADNNANNNEAQRKAKKSVTFGSGVPITREEITEQAVRDTTTIESLIEVIMMHNDEFEWKTDNEGKLFESEVVFGILDQICLNNFDNIDIIPNLYGIRDKLQEIIKGLKAPPSKPT